MNQLSSTPATGNSFSEHPSVALLERDIRVIGPVAWWILVVVALLVGIVLAWSFFGQLPTLVAGRCMLIGSGGLSEVRAGAAGRLADVRVRAGDVVRAGEIIASIAQPDQDERIKRIRARVIELEGRAVSVDSLSSRGLALNDSAFARRREFLNKQIEVAKSRAVIESNQVDTLRQLVEQRLATRRSVEDAERNQASAELAVEALRRQLGDLDRERTDVVKRETEEKSQVGLEMSEAKRELALLDAERGRATAVKSAFTGRVVEIKSGRGSLVSVDTPIVVLERSSDAGGAVEVVMYVASNNGKKIRTGAMAEILPATARRNEHGFLLGTVQYVSDYPATPQSLLATLGSEELVKDLIAVAAPFEVRIKLDRRNDGFRWTRDGIDAPTLHSGTLCNGNVFVRRERPIGFMIPALRKEST